MSRKILGLDIGNAAVSGVVINSGIKGSFVEARARVPLEGPQDFGGTLAGSLEALAGEIDITGTKCIVSLPAGSVSFRTLRLPFRDEKKLRQILPYELEPQLPYPVEDLIIDYYRSGPGRVDSSELITAAVKKTTIESLLAVLQSFRIDPAIITVGGFATALCLADTINQPENWILADIDKEDLSLFFTEAGTIKLARATRLPAFGEDHPATRVYRQIGRSLLACRDVYHFDFKADALFTNDPALIEPEHKPADSPLSGLPVDPTNLAKKISPRTIETGGQLPAPYLHDNALALGYLELSGLKGLDFRKGPFERKKQWRKYRKSMISSGALALLVLILFFSNILVDTYYLGKRADRLNHEIREVFKSALPDITRIVDPLQQLRIKIQESKRHLALPVGANKRARIIDLLNDLSSRIPGRIDVQMTRVVIGPDSILVSGNTDTFNSVDDIKNRLERADFFKKVVISSANLEKAGNRVNFKLKVTL